MYTNVNLVICPLCGDDLVKQSSPLYIEYRRGDTVQCQWYHCDLCDYDFKEDMYSPIEGINKEVAERVKEYDLRREY